MKCSPDYLVISHLPVILQRETITSYRQVPAKIFRAMFMAKPIVATDISDLTEILKDCGMIVKAGSVEQLSDAINYLYSHRQVMEKMGLCAKDRIERHYSWRHARDKLVSIFSKYEKNFPCKDK